MAERKMRYAVIDLTNNSVAVHETGVGHAGTWAVFNDELSFWICQNPEIVILTTGILTGTGSPGTGMMSWIIKDGENISVKFAEGCIGAYLKYAQLDALVIIGESSVASSIVIAENKIAIEENASCNETLKVKYSDENGTMLLLEEEGVLEDDSFFVADQAVASLLKKKNIVSISVVGYGVVPIEDPKKMKELCVELWQECVGKQRVPSRDIQRTRFLSYNINSEKYGLDAYEKRIKNADDLLFASLGIIWPEEMSSDKKYQYTGELLKASAGLEIELKMLREYVQSKIGFRMEGGPL